MAGTAEKAEQVSERKQAIEQLKVAEGLVAQCRGHLESGDIPRCKFRYQEARATLEELSVLIQFGLEEEPA